LEEWKIMVRSTVRSTVWLAVGGAMILVAGAAKVEAQDDFRWSGRIEQGRTLEVRGISGNIRAVRASGTIAEVVAEKRGRSRDFEEVEIQVLEDEYGVVVCVRYGSWNRGDGACDDDHGDHRGEGRRRRNIDVSVDFEVRVPSGVEFIGGMVTGDVEVIDVESDVTATSVSGDIYVSTTEVAWGSTVSGSIDIEMGSTAWDDLHFSTVSGDITLSLPADVDTEVEFESLSGDFEADFDIDIESRRRRMVGSRLRGVIGEGGRRLSFNTVSGDVTLRRARGLVR